MTREETIAQGIALCLSGYTVNDAAARLLLKPNALGTALRHQKALDELAALTSRTHHQLVADLGKSGVDQINRIPLNDAKRAAAELCHQARMNSNEVQQFAKEMADARSADDSNSVLARWREDMRERITATAGGRYRAPMSPLKDMALQERRFLSKVDALVHAHDRRPMSHDDRRDAIRHLRRVIAQCEGLIRKLEAQMPPPVSTRSKRAARAAVAEMGH